MEGDRSCLVREISQYMYDGFQVFQQYGTVDNIIKMIDRNLHRTVYIREDGQIVAVAIYFMVTDSTLQGIISHEIDLKNPDVFKRIEKEEGNNVHIFNVRADRVELILKGLKGLFKNLKPNTVSWYKDDELKNIRMIKCRHY